MKPKVFISYSSKDKAFAERLSQTLSIEGFDILLPTFAVDSKNSKNDWGSNLLKALKEADLFIPLVSTNYKHSDFSVFEFGAAFSLNKKMIPILISGNFEDMPLKLKSFHPVNAKKMDSSTIVNLIKRESQSMAA